MNDAPPSDAQKPDAEVLNRLFAVISARKGADPETSYTAKLFAKGTGKISQKVGEEAVETVIAALSQEADDLAAESADLLYHLLVLWADRGLTPEDVFAQLAAREGTSGITEKQNRKPTP
ncbi:MAG: phosphoribosyl-ATP diphosphatase [Magnetospiraceae bacterium]